MKDFKLKKNLFIFCLIPVHFGLILRNKKNHLVFFLSKQIFCFLLQLKIIIFIYGVIIITIERYIVNTHAHFQF